MAFELSKTQRIALNRTKNSVIDVAQSLWRNRMGMIGIVLLAMVLFVAIFAPYLAPYDPQKTLRGADGTAKILEPPSFSNPFGTTSQGQDVFSQWVFGARATLLVGFLSGISVMIVGTTVGLIAGYYKGTTDLLLMRVVDILYGIPATPFILVLVLFFGTTIWNIVLAMVLILWRTMARIIRSQTLSLAERPFVKSARASGASDARIILLHIAPNLLPLIFIETTIVMSGAIALEAGISFLGLGPAEMISWGGMLELTFTTGAIREAWWWVIPPGLGITMVILSFFYISRAFEDITNPEAGGRFS